MRQGLKISSIKHFGLLMLAVGLLLLQAGCMTPARRLDEDVVKREVVPGKKQQDVRQFFGPPKVMDKKDDGRMLDIYYMHFLKIQSTEARREVLEERTLSIMYDPDGNLKESKYYMGETIVAASGIQGWHAGRTFNSAMLKNIKQGITTRDDLIKEFGPATREYLSFTCHLEMDWYFLDGKQNDIEKGYEMSVALDPNLVVRECQVQKIGSSN